MFTLYLLLVPIITAWAMAKGYRSDRPELTRCGAVILGHAVVVQAWWVLTMPDTWQGYPFLFMAVSLAVVLRIICMVPAGKGNAILAGSVLFGILASLVYGTKTLAIGHTHHADWNYGLAQFTMAWANLIILLGWTHERSLDRVAGAGLALLAGLVRGAFARGVAR